MKNFFLGFLTVCLLTLSGCVTETKELNQQPLKTDPNLNQYSSNLLFVEFPKTYSAEENGDMLIISGANGKIIIGGFTPSVGHPDPEEKDFPYQGITYSKDPKMEPGAIPAALYYRNGDESTAKELATIFKSVKNLP